MVEKTSAALCSTKEKWNAIHREEEGDEMCRDGEVVSSCAIRHSCGCHGSCQNPWLHGISMPMFALHTSGCVCVWNPSMEDLTGCAAKDVVGFPLHNLLDIDSRQEFELALQSVLSGISGNSSCEVAFRGDARNTSTLSPCGLRVKVSCQRNKMGNILGVLGFAEKLNIRPTQTRKNAPVLLDERTLSFVQEAPVPIVGVDAEGNVILWNRKMQQITGYNADEAVTKKLGAFVYAKSQKDSLLQLVHTTYNERREGSIRLPFQNKDGLQLDLRLTMSAQQGRDDETKWVCIYADDVTDAVKIQNHAAELRQLVEDANTPIFGVNLQERINLWNNQTSQLTHYSLAEVVQKPLLEFFAEPALRALVQEAVQKALSGQSTSNLKLKFPIKSGDIRHILANIAPRRNLCGKICGAVVVVHDVTGMADLTTPTPLWNGLSEPAVKDELHPFIETANAPIFGTDKDGNINEWNVKASDISGYLKNEVIGLSLLEKFIVPHMKESVQRVLTDALQGRGTCNYEMEFATKSGEIRYLLVNTTTRKDTKNNVRGVMCVAQDITETIQRGRAVAAMALELRQLIDTANAPIFGIDNEGNVNEWNRRTQIITGYSKEEAFDEPLVETFIAPEMQDTVQRILDEALHGHETSNYELQFISKSGGPRFLLVNATTRRDPDNNIVGGEPCKEI